MKYPECDKLVKISEKSNLCGSFLDWGIRKSYFSKLKKFPGMEKTLAEYFEIDLNKIEAERRQILKDLKTPNKIKENE